MWRVARLMVIAAMLVCACARASEAGVRMAPVSRVVVPLARLDGWALSRQSGQPQARISPAYDASAARKVWASTPVGYDLGRVDFSRQAVLVLESGDSGSC